MPKLIVRLAVFIGSLNEKIGKATSLLISVLIVFLMIEVMSRYLFRSPTMWVYQSASMIFGCLCMLAGAYVLFNRRHIRIDILWSRLSLKKQLVLDLLTSVFFFLFIVLLVRYLGKAALESCRILEHAVTPWGPPVYPYKTVVFIGSFLVLIQGVAKFILDLNALLKR